MRRDALGGEWIRLRVQRLWDEQGEERRRQHADRREGQERDRVAEGADEEPGKNAARHHTEPDRGVGRALQQIEVPRPLRQISDHENAYDAVESGTESIDD